VAFKPPLVDNEIPSSAKWNQAVGVYDRAGGDVDVVSSVTETAIYSASIGAGHMSSDRALRLTLLGDFLQNASGNFTARVKLGGTPIATLTSNVGLSGNRRDMELALFVKNRGAANAQYWKGLLVFGATGSGTAWTSDSGRIGWSFVATSTVDTAAAQTLEVTVQWDVSGASLSFRKREAMLELLG
jgi:hypothetical protein